ncbi:D-2-hydroxyacid dehydrogenase [Paenibacillus caui]|uniref:D-2-hydroxyacid dehydrogenase n=1 Tax=Paenibacillus caui TaxID=2873927 RepID=UPI001CA84041|nr:D-2-hydroxyacid dehydrogenase [Paenibacillus caui]
MGKIVALQSLGEAYKTAIQEAAPGWSLVDGSDPEALQEHLQDAEILLGWNKAAAEITLQDGTSLKWVQNIGAGVDQLPLERFSQLGITLTNASGVHPFPISEHIFAMLLSLTRRLHTAVRNQSGQVWDFQTEGIGEAHGKTMGILGVGAIGVETARLAKAFQMKVLGVRKSGSPNEYVDTMYTLDRLNEMLKHCDYVVNCLPHTRETEKLIGKEQFSIMKPSAFYINIGRGKTTDTDAMVQALQSQSIAGAGLDVFEPEPLPADHPLWAMDNVMITPHMAGLSTSYIERLAAIFIGNLKAYVQGQAPSINVVDLVNEY